MPLQEHAPRPNGENDMTMNSHFYRQYNTMYECSQQTG